MPLNKKESWSCNQCNGTGVCRRCHGHLLIGSNKEKCPECHAGGKCYRCRGTGRSPAKA